MADNDDQEPRAAEGVELRNRIKAAPGPQQDLLGDMFGPQVAENVEYEDPDFITADRAIVEKLRLADFQGLAWAKFAESLVRYGRPVMKYWLVTGIIFTKCQAKGFGLERPTREKWLRADHEGFANEVLARGLNSFKQSLQRGVWSHKGGATLRTFFMNACVFEFPNLYRKWLTADSQSPAPTIQPPDIDTRPDPHLSFDELVDMRIEIQKDLRSIDDITKSAVLLDFAGYSHREIGEFLSITSRAVEGRLRRQRERWRNKPGWGRGGNDG